MDTMLRERCIWGEAEEPGLYSLWARGGFGRFEIRQLALYTHPLPWVAPFACLPATLQPLGPSQHTDLGSFFMSLVILRRKRKYRGSSR